VTSKDATGGAACAGEDCGDDEGCGDGEDGEGCWDGEVRKVEPTWLTTVPDGSPSSGSGAVGDSLSGGHGRRGPGLSPVPEEEADADLLERPPEAAAAGGGALSADGDQGWSADGPGSHGGETGSGLHAGGSGRSATDQGGTAEDGAIEDGAPEDGVIEDGAIKGGAVAAGGSQG
jgi:hypothetical protein